MTRKGFIGLGVVFVVGLSLAVNLLMTTSVAHAQQPQKPIVLRALTAWPVHVGQNYWYHEFIKVANERAEKGGVPLKIEKTGGPEVVGTMQQFGAMRSGTVDMVYTSGDYFTGETIELSAISCIRPDPLYLLTTIRDTGVMDIVNEACRKKSGSIALFPTLMGRGFTLLSTKPIKPGDWSGMRIRSIGGMTATGIPAMGGSALLIPPAEVFDALQRGTIDAAVGSASDRYSLGERGVYKYILMPRFFESATYWFMAAKVWDGLPDNVKTFFKGLAKSQEDEGFPWCRKWDDDNVLKFINEDKVKLVWCTPEEEHKIAKAFRANYLDVMVQKSPDYGARIQKVLKDYVY